jgi:hypothetical protein
VTCRLAAAGAGIDRDTGLHGGAGGDSGDRGAGEVVDAMGGAEDTNDDIWVESTVNEVSTRECREGGSPVAAIAAPAGREGERPGNSSSSWLEAEASAV